LPSLKRLFFVFDYACAQHEVAEEHKAAFASLRLEQLTCVVRDDEQLELAVSNAALTTLIFDDYGDLTFSSAGVQKQLLMAKNVTRLRVSNLWAGGFDGLALAITEMPKLEALILGDEVRFSFSRFPLLRLLRNGSRARERERGRRLS
jgi:hypothetical protein